MDKTIVSLFVNKYQAPSTQPRTGAMNRKELDQYICQLANDYGSIITCNPFTIHDLWDDEQSKLIELFLSYSGTSVSQCLDGSDERMDNNFNTALFALLSNNNSDNLLAFESIARKNIIAYVEQTCLQQIINDVCADKIQYENAMHNYYPRRDENNGELYYARV